MTAKEMFEELGYKLDINHNFLDYWKFEETKYAVISRHIWFDLNNKSYSTINIYEIAKIDMPTHRAIQKQLEELGWLKE